MPPKNHLIYLTKNVFQYIVLHSIELTILEQVLCIITIMCELKANIGDRMRLGAKPANHWDTENANNNKIADNMPIYLQMSSLLVL